MLTGHWQNQLARSMSTQKKTTYHHGNLKAALIDAAFKSLESQSLDSLSLRGLAKEAGVSPTAAYNHFSDKMDLLVEIKTEAFRRFERFLRNAVETEKPDTVDGRIMSLGRAYIQFANVFPSVYDLLFGWTPSQDHMTDELNAAAADCEFLIGQYMNELVDEACPNGASSYKQSIASFISWALVHGITTLIQGGNVEAAARCENYTPEFMMETPESREKLFRDMLSILLTGIRQRIGQIEDPEGTPNQ